MRVSSLIPSYCYSFLNCSILMQHLIRFWDKSYILQTVITKKNTFGTQK